MRRTLLDRFRQIQVAGRFVPASLTLVGLFLTAIALAAQEKRSYSALDDRLELFSRPYAVLDGNEFYCIVLNSGNICDNVFNSPWSQGGHWPVVPSGYVFNSGFQIAGIVGPDGGPWAGDTTGAFFYDERGTQPAGTALTDVFDSAEPDDLANWPDEARIAGDPFLPADAGRAALSEQDSWVRYWEGDPARLSGRPHPLGVRVTQRSMQWPYPSGNESVIYFLADITNVTGTDDFRRLNEAAFFAGEDRLPDDGYSLTEVYVAAAADMDVTSNAGQNNSTAILPFDLALSYHGGFRAPDYPYPPQQFYPPFFVDAPGLVAIKFLATPGDGSGGSRSGLTFWTEYTGSSTGWPSPVGTGQLWRYLAGKHDTAQGDNPCAVTPYIAGPTPAEAERALCYAGQTPRDTRFAMGSGPFELSAGENKTLAVAYIVAPTLATLPDSTPTGIVANSSDDSANPPGVPSFHPGFPGARGCSDMTATSCSEVDPINDVRPIERAAGWVAYDGPAPSTALESPDQKLDQYAVETATHSLLDRAMVAQTIFDAKFLRPMPPEPPEFYLLPGANSATIVWEPSSTDESGDPFIELAGDPRSVLYNPNYREFDVHGYEIWRGTSADDLELLQVFYHRERNFVDMRCELVRPTEDIDNEAGRGFSIGETCPPDFQKADAFPRFFNNGGPGGRPGKGVARSAAGTAFLVDSLGALPRPEWDGVPVRSSVPFVYRDTSLANNFSYFYAVTAFDLNSPTSGPPVQRSDRLVKSVLPRVDAPNLVDAELVIGVSGDDGMLLDTSAPMPGVSSEDGTFDGPMPPTDAFILGFAPLVPQLLPQLTLTVTIDSIVPRHTGNAPTEQEFEPTATGFCEGGASPGGGRVASPFGACWDMYLSVNRDGSVSRSVATGYNPWWNAFGETGSFSFNLLDAPVDFDQDALDAFGIPSGTGFATLDVTVNEGLNNSAAEGAQNRRFENYHTGARWFDGNSANGATNTIADPSKYRRVGHVNAADTIFAPISHTPIDENDIDPNSTDNGIMFSRQCFNRAMAFLDRTADAVFTWDGPTVRVRDVTHNVDVQFTGRAGPTWGFLTTDANGNGVLDWHDFNYIDGAIQIIRQVDGGNCNAATFGPFDADGMATPVRLGNRVELVSTSTDLNTNVDLEAGAALPRTGLGFGLYVYGHRFIFEMARPPDGGTEWTFRSFQGNLGAGLQVPDPSGYVLNRDPAGGSFASGRGPVLPPHVPGLTFRYEVDRAALSTTFADLSEIHTVPDPYFFWSAYDGGDPGAKQLLFVNLPPRATIRVYSLSGILVDVIDHDDATGGGQASWDLRNRNGQYVASGVYFWHVVTETGEERVGKFTIVNPNRD